jgi:tRNA A-37 threonylcarbamoyl transferase component Bud32
MPTRGRDGFWFPAAVPGSLFPHSVPPTVALVEHRSSSFPAFRHHSYCFFYPAAVFSHSPPASNVGKSPRSPFTQASPLPLRHIDSPTDFAFRSSTVKTSHRQAYHQTPRSKFAPAMGIRGLFGKERVGVLLDASAGEPVPASAARAKKTKSNPMSPSPSGPPLASSQCGRSKSAVSPRSLRNFVTAAVAMSPRLGPKPSKDVFSKNFSNDAASDAGESSSGERLAPVIHHTAEMRTPKSRNTAAIEARTIAAAAAAEAAVANTAFSATLSGERGEAATDDDEGLDVAGGMLATLPDRREVARAARTRKDASAAKSFTALSDSSLRKQLTSSDPFGLSQHWMIDRSAITLGKTIGHSSFGMVNEGRLNGTKVAVKTISRDPKNKKGDDIEAFKKEAALNCKLRHPNVVLFMGICVQEREVCIVTELMARGNVRDLLVGPVQGKSVKLEWSVRLQWGVDTAQGMAYLHSLNPPMIHRDLKTTNLLVDRGMNCRIADFGLSRFQADDKIMSAVGTVQFAAPEVLRHEKYTEKADLFSFGTVLWELYTRKRIFKNMPQIEVYKAVIGGHMPAVPGDCDERYAKLIRNCWHLDPSKRPSFREVLDRLGPLGDELDSDI